MQQSISPQEPERTQTDGSAAFIFLFLHILANMEEANKLIGMGKKQLVMGKVVEAVNTLQEACGMLAKTYGDTADECGEAFYWCGKALLDLARMENSVLGNALQGVPEEEEDEEKPKDSSVEMESTENLDEKIRDELRVQVYDAMAEKKEDSSAEKKDEKDEKKAESTTEKTEDAKDKMGDSTSEVTEDGDTEQKKDEDTTAEKSENASVATEKAEENQSGAPEEDELSSKTKEEDKTSDDKPDESDENKENIAADMKTDKEKEAEKEMTDEAEKEKTDKMEEAEEDDEEEGDEEMEGDEEAEEAETDKEKAEGEDTADKGSDDEEVGNLQLAWEMLEVAKVIYKRKESKEDQLMAAQTHLKLGEVSAESGNYTQALEDFQECLKLQLKHLAPDSRLLAETYYQLGLTYSLNCQYKQAIDELNSSISAIKSRLDKLQELINKAEGPEALPDERKEMEELKALLPEIQEKVEDANEGLKTASTDAEAVKDVLDGCSSAENGDNQISTKVNGTQSGSQTAVSNISHLVRKKRKPEESPVKEGVVKKVKQDEAQTDGVEEHQTNGHTNGMEVESK